MAVSAGRLTGAICDLVFWLKFLEGPCWRQLQALLKETGKAVSAFPVFRDSQGMIPRGHYQMKSTCTQTFAVSFKPLTGVSIL